jgi:hypothetical protein
MLKTTIAAALLSLAAATHAAPVIYFGENLAPANAVSGAPVTARNSFLSSLVGVASEGFESFNDATGAPLNLSFTGSGGMLSAQLAGGGAIETSAQGIPDGRFNTTTGGDKFWEASSASFSISFGTAISAFGFYGTDIGDFNGQVRLMLIDVNDVQTELLVPHTQNGNSGSLLFFGFIDAANSYKSITFSNTGSGGDFLGFDDMVIGDQRQVNPGIPEPGSLALVGLSLVGLALGGRRR